MRKILLFIISLLIICSGCSRIENDPQELNTDFSITSGVISGEELSWFTYSSDYYVDIFNNNIIDKELSKSISNDDIPLNLLYGEYLSSWQLQLSFTLQQLKGILSDEQYALLQQHVDSWEDSMIVMNDFYVNAVFESNRSKYGTMFYDEYLMRLAIQYREKVKELKYIHFILETKLDESLYSPDLKSLQFQ